MLEAVEAVPVNFLGLDDAVQRLTRKILGRESAWAWPELVASSDSRRREFVAAFATRVWLARRL